MGCAVAAFFLVAAFVSGGRLDAAGLAAMAMLFAVLFFYFGSREAE